jgi:hypothetical protein
MMMELVGGFDGYLGKVLGRTGSSLFENCGIKMEESAKEGSDGEVRWMDGWMVGEGMVW